jgi:hypothetical protein
MINIQYSNKYMSKLLEKCFNPAKAATIEVIGWRNQYNKIKKIFHSLNSSFALMTIEKKSTKESI